jgi:predicted kinase
MNNLEFTITVGISGSGKTTWLLENSTGKRVISPDEIRRELTGDVSDQTKNKEVFKIAFERVINALNNGVSVIFDATNVVSVHRFNMLKQLKDNVVHEFKPNAKVFIINPETAKERIRIDIENGADRSNVPDHAIDRQYKMFVEDLDKLGTDGYLLIQ